MTLLTNNYNVKGDGVSDDSDAIMGCLDMLSRLGGGELYFPAGTYDIGKTLAIGSNITLHGAKGAVIRDHATLGSNPLLTVTDAKNVSFRDIRFRNGQAIEGVVTGKNGIVITGSSNITMTGCRITEISGHYGMLFRKSNKIRITSSKFQRCTYAGLSFQVECNDIVIDYCTFDTATNKTLSQTYLLHCGSDKLNYGEYFVKNVRVTNSKFLNNPRWEGIDFHEGENILIENNYIENVRMGIMCGSVAGYVANPVLKNVVIRNNKVIQGSGQDNHYGIVAHGLEQSPGENIVIDNNVINGFGGSKGGTIGAITIYETKNVVIRNNQMTRYKDIGIGLYHGNDRVGITNNIIVNPRGVEGQKYILPLWVTTNKNSNIMTSGNLYG